MQSDLSAAGEVRGDRCRENHTAPLIHCCSFCFGAAPTWREAISPPLKIIKVGIDITPYFAAVFGLSSTLSFTILTLSPIAPEISASAGAILLHGPHHSAQKSTTTGPVALSTSASKSASEPLPTAMGIPRSVKHSGADENRAPDDMSQPMNAILPGQARSRRDDRMPVPRPARGRKSPSIQAFRSKAARRG